MFVLDHALGLAKRLGPKNNCVSGQLTKVAIRLKFEFVLSTGRH